MGRKRGLRDKRAMEILDKLLEIIADECTWELRVATYNDTDICFEDHLRYGLMWSVETYARQLGYENAEYIKRLPKEVFEEIERHYRRYLEELVEWYREDDYDDDDLPDELLDELV
jgi:serine phosphatase RsbU (regulator of sigma subunit)